MNNYIIGTHDSATGEKGRGFLSWLVTPFARTQDLTIKQQFANGVRFFDIRIKYVDGMWHCGHGIWTSRKSAYQILSEINGMAATSVDKVYVSICYEGKIKTGRERAKFLEFVSYVQKTLHHLCLSDIAIKLPTWENIYADNMETAPYPLIHLFKTLDYSTWHTYFPCPRFWNMFYRDAPQEYKTNLYDFYE